MGATIPPPDRKSQYRITGRSALPWGSFFPSDDDSRQGVLLTPDELPFPARSAFPWFRPKRHQLEQAIAWRVWPRSARQQGAPYLRLASRTSVLDGVCNSAS